MENNTRSLGELAREDRNKPLNLKSLYVRNNSGEMIQFDNLVTLKESTAPPQLYRYNRFVAATISAPDWPKGKPSVREWRKWIRLQKKYLMILSGLHLQGIPRISGKVHPA